MRQIRWIELIMDYDCTIEYHHGKANALCLKNKATLSKSTLWHEQPLTELKEMRAELGIKLRGELIAQLIVRPTYQEQIL